MNSDIDHVYLSDEESAQVCRAAKDLGIQDMDAIHGVTRDFRELSRQAREHKQQHGDLDGWLPPKPKPAGVGAELAGIEREARAKRREVLRDAGVVTVYLNAMQILAVLTGAMNDCMQDKGRPRAADLLRGCGVPASEVSKLASKGSKHIKAAWVALSQHAHVKEMGMHDVRNGRRDRSIQNGRLANAVAEIYELADRTKDRQRISKLEQRDKEREQRMAELEQRVAALEVGDNWKAIAERMRAEGASFGQIAIAVGKSKSTVVSHCKASAA